MSTFSTAPPRLARARPRPSRARPSSLRGCRRRSRRRSGRPRRRTGRRSRARCRAAAPRPVRISAPVSTCSRARGRRRRTAASMNAPSAAPSMVVRVDVRREQDLRLVQHVAFDRDVAAVLALELQAREQQVRGRRADVDAHAGEDHAVLLGHVAVGRGEAPGLRPLLGGRRVGRGLGTQSSGIVNCDALGRQPAAVLVADERVFLVVQDRPAALVDAEQVARFARRRPARRRCPSARAGRPSS